MSQFSSGHWKATHALVDGPTPKHMHTALDGISGLFNKLKMKEARTVKFWRMGEGIGLSMIQISMYDIIKE